MAIELLAIAGEGYTMPSESRVNRLDLAGLIALFRHIEDLPNPSVAEDVIGYGECINRLHEAGTIIPMRFGSVLNDEEALRVFVDQHRHEFEERIHSISDCSEMVARLLVIHEPGHHPQPVSSDRPGTGYLTILRNRSHLEELAKQELRDVEGKLQHLYRENKYETRDVSGVRFVYAYYLVPNAALKDFLDLLIAFDWGERLDISGPFPPWSFSSPSCGESLGV